MYAQSAIRSVEGAQEALRERYRHKVASAFKDDRERLVYLLTRLPQTSLVLEGLLRSLCNVLKEVRSIRDFGAGPATLLWAVHPIAWPLERIDLIERDLGIRSLGDALLKHYPSEQERCPIKWYSSIDQSVRDGVDLTVASYSLGEVKALERREIVEKLFQPRKEALLSVEPGSPQGVGVIRDVLEQ
ncbi:MAG: small ribosomal subunit Rsm22 family protein, partial [Candidatus Nucleicultricaceae bacterium]